ncbi:hypothetical protein [Phreatobacter sp.]|uniref:hypothetical protein n=1 Tax=Phreatobacter sp. TaxID=1966341 RepID=UPI004036F244
MYIKEKEKIMQNLPTRSARAMLMLLENQSEASREISASQILSAFMESEFHERKWTGRDELGFVVPRSEMLEELTSELDCLQQQIAVVHAFLKRLQSDRVASHTDGVTAKS